MKKKLSLILSIVMTLSLFTGCAPKYDESNEWEFGSASTFDVSTSSEDTSPISSTEYMPVVSTRNPLLPVPDPETSDMDTFYPGNEDFPDIDSGTLATNEWMTAFKNEYTGKRIRIAYIYLEGPYQTNDGGFYMIGDNWYFEIDKDTVDSINSYKDIFGPDGVDYVVDAIVSDHYAPGQDSSTILLTNCNLDVAMGMPWWKDSEYGDGGSSYNKYSMRDFIANPTRFLYDHDGERIILTDVLVGSIERTYVTGLTAGDASSIAEAWDMSWSQVYFSFDDFKSSGAYYLEEDQIISVIGTISGDYLTYDMYMYDCEFVTG